MWGMISTFSSKHWWNSRIAHNLRILQIVARKFQKNPFFPLFLSKSQKFPTFSSIEIFFSDSESPSFKAYLSHLVCLYLAYPCFSGAIWQLLSSLLPTKVKKSVEKSCFWFKKLFPLVKWNFIKLIAFSRQKFYSEFFTFDFCEYI